MLEVTVHSGYVGECYRKKKNDNQTLIKGKFSLDFIKGCNF